MHKTTTAGHHFHKAHKEAKLNILFKAHGHSCKNRFTFKRGNEKDFRMVGKWGGGGHTCGFEGIVNVADSSLVMEPQDSLHYTS